MNVNKRLIGIYIKGMLVLGVCQIIGASVKNNGEQTAETLVAVAGVSPALLNTAISLFNHTGMDSNWPNSLLLGGKDKFFPFSLMDAPKPLKPLLPPAPLPVSKPQQLAHNDHVEEKDQSNGSLAPLTPSKPLQPLETMESTSPQEVEAVDANAVPPGAMTPSQTLASGTIPQEAQSSDVESLISSPFAQFETAESDPALNGPNHDEISAVTHPGSPIIQEVEYGNQTSGEALYPGSDSESTFEVESLQNIANTNSYAPSGPAPQSPSYDWNQSSQGNHQAGGNQQLSMNLNANQANFTATNSINMQVTSDGTGSSNTHHFGYRGNSKPSQHPGQSVSGSTNYVIKFKRTKVFSN